MSDFWRVFLTLAVFALAAGPASPQASGNEEVIFEIADQAICLNEDGTVWGDNVRFRPPVPREGLRAVYVGYGMMKVLMPGRECYFHRHDLVLARVYGVVPCPDPTGDGAVKKDVAGTRGVPPSCSQ